MATVQEDWPDVESSARLGKVNALYHLQFGHEYAPGKVYQSVATGSHSFTGQIAAWLDQYFPPHVGVTVAAIRDDARPVGLIHNPQGLMAECGTVPESAFRYTGHWQREAASTWNLYFDSHNLDLMLTPSQFQDSHTFSDWMTQTVPMLVKQADGSFVEQPIGGGSSCNLVHYCWFKPFAVPKVTIPLGLDERGRPVSITAWGRAIPKESMYLLRVIRTHSCTFL